MDYGDKLAPVQGFTPGIPWEMHLRAYDVYRKEYGEQKALIEGWCRGGFGCTELDNFIPGWREEVSQFAALKKQVESLQAELAKSQAQVKWHKGCEGHCDEELEALKAELQQAREALKFQVGQKLKYYEALEKLHKVIYDRHHGRMPDEVRIAMDNAKEALSPSAPAELSPAHKLAIKLGKAFRFQSGEPL
jgi:hypothetical protein